MTQSEKCHYKFTDGVRCPRLIDRERYCIYHAEFPYLQKDIARFWWRLKRLALKGDGDWRGFNFPQFNIERVSCPVVINASGARFQNISLSDVTFDGQVNISDSRVEESVEIKQCHFDKTLTFNNVIFSDFNLNQVIVSEDIQAINVEFHGDFRVSGSFKKRAVFNQCFFAKKAEFIKSKMYSLSVSSTLSLGSSITGNLVVKHTHNLSFIEKIGVAVKEGVESARFRIRIIRKKINMFVFRLNKKFQASVKKQYQKYREKIPHQRKGVTKYLLFDGEAHFENVIFAEPQKVLFKGVNLQNASFSGTDLRGVTFIGNNWYQPRLKRNGLKEELNYHALNNYYDKKEALPNLENTYRNIRFSLESNKDFASANDFFVGEMEAKRKQLPWFKRRLLSVLAGYKIVSNYGTSPLRCALWFATAVLSHTIIIAYLIASPVYLHLSNIFVSIGRFAPARFFHWSSSIVDQVILFFKTENLLDSITYSIQTMTLQKDKVGLINSDFPMVSGVSFTNAIFAILGPILIGLIALTIRTRIKRN